MPRPVSVFVSFAIVLGATSLVSVATPPEGIAAEVVAITRFDQLNNLNGGVEGKIVYYHTPLDPSLEPMAAYGRSTGCASSITVHV